MSVAAILMHCPKCLYTGRVIMLAGPVEDRKELIMKIRRKQWIQ